jgi:hypothetical protein
MVLKCSSWNIRRRAVLAAAFPETPWIWIQRDPARVLASLLAEPPGWFRLQAAPCRAARLFGLDPAAIPAMARAEFAARALGAMLEAAAKDPARRLCSTMPICRPRCGSAWHRISDSRPILRQWHEWLKSLGSTRRTQHPSSLPAMPRSAAR